MMPSHEEPGRTPGESSGIVKWVVVAAFLAVGVGTWLLLRPGPTPDLSAYSSASRAGPSKELPPVVGLRVTTTSEAGKIVRVTESLRDLGEERTQTAPGTFVVAQKLLRENGATETWTRQEVRIGPATASAWPPVNAAPPEVDLLAGLDLKAARVQGEWKRTADGAICSDLERLTRLDLGYRPPAEYDLRVTFSRLQGNDGFDIILVAGGRRFYWTFAGWDNTVSGFGTVLGQTAEANSTTVKRPAWFTNGTRHTAVFEVRRDGVRVSLDGERVADHRTDYRDLNLVLRTLRWPGSIGFSTWESSYALHDVRLIEIAGHGQRPGPAAVPNTRPATGPTVLQAVAAVDFSVAGQKAKLYFLYPDGSVEGVRERGQWAVAGDRIVFRWGEFVDTCTLAADRKSFAGRNQIGDAIRGVVRAGTL